MIHVYTSLDASMEVQSVALSLCLISRARANDLYCARYGRKLLLITIGLHANTTIAEAKTYVQRELWYTLVLRLPQNIRVSRRTQIGVRMKAKKARAA